MAPGKVQKQLGHLLPIWFQSWQLCLGSSSLPKHVGTWQTVVHHQVPWHPSGGTLIGFLVLVFRGLNQ